MGNLHKQRAGEHFGNRWTLEVGREAEGETETSVRAELELVFRDEEERGPTHKGSKKEHH